MDITNAALEYRAFYVATSIICLIINVVLYANLLENAWRHEEILTFRRLLFEHGLLTVVTLFWSFASFNNASQPVLAMFRTANVLLLSVLVFSWVLFAEAYMGNPVKLKHKRLLAVPVFIAPSIALVETLFGVGNVAPVYTVSFAVDCAYLAAAMVHVAIKNIRAESAAQKHKYLFAFVFMTFPIAGAAAGILIPNVQFIVVCLTPALVGVFIDIQGTSVYTDALTGLNSRYKIQQFLESHWSSCSIENPTLVIIIDMNDFKRINDSHGHNAGDDALVAMANAMKKVAGNERGLAIGRWGGDEFMMARLGKIDPEKVKVELYYALAEELAAKNLDYDLSLSMGYAWCVDSKESIKSAIDRADKMLFEEKAKWHEEHRWRYMRMLD